MISLRHNLHRNNYPEQITLAPRNLDRTIEDNTQKITTVCLPYVKGLAKSIQNICSPYDIGTIFTSGSTLWKYIFRVKSRTEFNMIKNYVYLIPCSCGKIYNGQDRSPTKSKARRSSEGSNTRWDWKVGVWWTIYGRKKETICPYGMKLKWLIEKNIGGLDALKESAHIVGLYSDLLSRPSIEMYTIWEPVIKKVRLEKKWVWARAKNHT